MGCWRLYDADMPEYALAVDLYTGAGPDEGRRWLYVQEYAAPDTVDPERRAPAARGSAVGAARSHRHRRSTHVHLRTRRRQKEGGQYEKVDRREEFHVVRGGRAAACA